MDALKISGSISPIWDMSGNWVDIASIATLDITYHVTSIAPTDTTDNRIVLDKIVYTPADGSTLTTIIDSIPLVFAPAYTLTLIPPTDIQIGVSSTFTGQFTSHTPQSLSPQII